MAKKRRGRAPNGAGSVYKTTAGKWKAVISIRTVDGSTKRISRNAKSFEHGWILLDQLRREHRNLADNPNAVTVRDAIERWLQGFEGEQSTRDGYQNLLDRHIGPRLGDVCLLKLNSMMIQDWITQLKAAAVGARTLQMSYALLKRACSWSVAARIIDHNPCDGVRRPSAKREAILPFTRAEVDQILEATKADRLHALYRLALTTGMRQGELFGLLWSDVDLDAGILRVRQQAKDYAGRISIQAPKTAAGVRSISLTPAVVQSLRSRKLLAEAEGNGAFPYVFCSAKGTVIRRTNFGKRYWKPLLVHLGLKHRGAHHLRHTAATMMLSAGVPPHIVAGVLGHETAETVMRIYAHFITQDSRQAAEAMGRLNL